MLELNAQQNEGFVCTEHLVARIVLMRTVCQVVLSGSHPSCLAQTQDEAVCTSRNMSYITPEMTSTFSPCTRTPSCPSARPTSTSPIVHSSEMDPCHDPQQVSIRHMADVPPITFRESKSALQLCEAMLECSVALSRASRVWHVESWDSLARCLSFDARACGALVF